MTQDRRLTPYEIRHLVDHLERASAWPQLNSLLTSFASAGSTVRMVWAELRFAFDGHYGGFLADLDRLWRWAETHRDVRTSVCAALIASTLRSGNVRLSPKIVLGLVRTGTTAGRWTMVAALDHALAHFNDAEKSELIRDMSRQDGPGDGCDDSLPWRNVIALARTIGSRKRWLRVFVAVAARVPSHLIDEVISAAVEHVPADRAGKVLAALVRRAGELDELARHSLAAAVRAARPPAQPALLLGLARHAADNGPSRGFLARQALDVIGQLKPTRRVAALARASAQLPIDSLDAAEELLRKSGTTDATIPARAALALRRPPQERDELIGQLLHDTSAVPDYRVRYESLLALRHALPVPLRRRADAVMASQLETHAGHPDHFVFVCDAVTRVDFPLLMSVVATLRGQRSDSLRFVLKQVGPRLLGRPHLAREICHLLLSFDEGGGESRARTLAALEPYLPSTEFSALLRENAGVFDDLGDLGDNVLETLLPPLVKHLPPEIARGAFRLMKRLEHDRVVCRFLQAIVPALPADLLADAVAETEALRWSPFHAWAVVALRARLPADKFDQLLVRSVAHLPKMTTDLDRALFLSGVAPCLTAAVVGDAVRFGDLTAIPEDASTTTTVLQALAAGVPSAIWPDLVSQTSRQYGLRREIEVLHTVIARMGDDSQPWAAARLATAFEELLALSVRDRTILWFLAQHATLLPAEQVPLAWRAAAGATGETAVKLMTALLHRLPKPTMPRAYEEFLAVARFIGDERTIRRVEEELAQNDFVDDDAVDGNATSDAVPMAPDRCGSTVDVEVGPFPPSIPNCPDVSPTAETATTGAAAGSQGGSPQPSWGWLRGLARRLGLRGPTGLPVMSARAVANAAPPAAALSPAALQFSSLQALNSATVQMRAELYPQFARTLPASALPQLLRSLWEDRPGYPLMNKDQVSDVLVVLADRSPVSTLRDVVRAALDLLYDDYLIHPVLRAAAARLPFADRTRCASEALDQAAPDELAGRGPPRWQYVTPVLTVFGSWLPDDRVPDALGVVPKHTVAGAFNYRPLDAYFALAHGRSPTVADRVYREALRFLGGAWYGPSSSEADFEQLVRRLPTNLLADAVAVARKWCPTSRSPNPPRSREALTACRTALVEMARRAPTGELADALGIAVRVLRTPTGSMRQSEFLAALAARGTEPVLLRAVAAASALRDSFERSEALPPLLRRLTSIAAATSELQPSHVDAGLAAVRRIADYGRAELVGDLDGVLRWLRADAATRTEVRRSLALVARWWP
jgi:hypothetical protein